MRTLTVGLLQAARVVVLTPLFDARLLRRCPYHREVAVVDRCQSLCDVLSLTVPATYLLPFLRRGNISRNRF